MSTLTEVENAVRQFSAEQLAELEQFVRKTRLMKTRRPAGSVLNLPPLDLGQMREPLGRREEWYDEMLENRL